MAAPGAVHVLDLRGSSDGGVILNMRMAVFRAGMTIPMMGVVRQRVSRWEHRVGRCGVLYLPYE